MARFGRKIIRSNSTRRFQTALSGNAFPESGKRSPNRGTRCGAPRIGERGAELPESGNAVPESELPGKGPPLLSGGVAKGRHVCHPLRKLFALEGPDFGRPNLPQF